MATYAQIEERVRKTSGFTPKTCWIAHILSEHGLTKRMAPNRADPNARAHPCPAARKAAIEDALRHFGMIRENG